jgi:hypothetical protein
MLAVVVSDLVVGLLVDEGMAKLSPTATINVSQ